MFKKFITVAIDSYLQQSPLFVAASLRVLGYTSVLTRDFAAFDLHIWRLQAPEPHLMPADQFRCRALINAVANAGSSILL